MVRCQLAEQVLPLLGLPFGNLESVLIEAAREHYPTPMDDYGLYGAGVELIELDDSRTASWFYLGFASSELLPAQARTADPEPRFFALMGAVVGCLERADDDSLLHLARREEMKHAMTTPLLAETLAAPVLLVVLPQELKLGIRLLRLLTRPFPGWQHVFKLLREAADVQAELGKVDAAESAVRAAKTRIQTWRERCPEEWAYEERRSAFAHEIVDLDLVQAACLRRQGRFDEAKDLLLTDLFPLPAFYPGPTAARWDLEIALTKMKVASLASLRLPRSAAERAEVVTRLEPEERGLAAGSNVHSDSETSTIAHLLLGMLAIGRGDHAVTAFHLGGIQRKESTPLLRRRSELGFHCALAVLHVTKPRRRRPSKLVEDVASSLYEAVLDGYDPGPELLEEACNVLRRHRSRQLEIFETLLTAQRADVSEQVDVGQDDDSLVGAVG
jgi:hypothetical protein